MTDLQSILDHITSIENGFKHIIEAGDQILSDQKEDHFQLAMEFLKSNDYQVRMLATYILGQLSPTHPEALEFMKEKISPDPNWRVQEMLAKSFDYYCSASGYEESLPEIRKWLSDPDANIKRAVIEGLRIWTGRPYFKDHPEAAIDLISKHRADESEYVRKSTGNALRDIGKKHPDLINRELSGWDLKDKKTLFTYKLAKGKK